MNKSIAFIDFQKQESTIEFSINRMDSNDAQLLYEAVELLSRLTIKGTDPDRASRIEHFKKEFKNNIYTQNFRKPLIH